MAWDGTEHPAAVTTTYSGDEMSAVAIDFVERYCNRIIAPLEVVEFHDGGHIFLRLLKGPLITGGTVIYDMIAAEAVSSDLYTEQADGDIHYINHGFFPWGKDRYRVTYDAGYSDTGDLPRGLEALVEDVGTWMSAHAGTTGLRREQFGRDYAWEAALAIDIEAAPLLKRLNLWVKL